MANRLQNTGISLDSIFQSYVLGDIVSGTITNIQNGGIDIRTRYAGRDNKVENAASFVNITFGNINLSSLYNKFGAKYDVTISGSTTYNGVGQTPTLIHNPSNTPIQATISSLTNAGSYTPSNFIITLPGNYISGTYSGTYIINKKSITTFSSSYVYISTASFWIVYSVTFGGGVPGGSFNNFTIFISSNASPGDALIPVTISGTFDGSGNYTYTFPSGGSVVYATPVNILPGNLGLDVNSSTNYSGSLTTKLLKAV